MELIKKVQLDMTSKERITVAMAGGVPDRVPITLGLSEMVPVRYFTDDYIQFFWVDKIPLWQARVETEVKRFGADGFLHLVAGPSPHDCPTETSDIRETGDEVAFKSIVHTSQGPLSADFSIHRASPLSMRTPWVKDPQKDFDKIVETLKNPDTKDISEIHSAYNSIGNQAHVGFWLDTPVDWWVGLRGAQDMIMDLMDFPELMHKYFSVYTEYAVALTEYVLSHTALDSVGLGGSSTSMSVINPTLHREFSLDFGKAISNVAHKYGRCVQYHMCGKSRAAIPITKEMGVDGFDALESPPTGDVDLAQVKSQFGATTSLRGNVNSITVMREGTFEDVFADVRRCMDAAKSGGGFILGVGDQTPYDTPEENINAFVEAGLKYGCYSP